MKKVITILLVLLFILNEFSFIAIYIPLKKLASYIQKTNIEKGFDDDDVSLIVIKKSDLEKGMAQIKFVENSEIVYNNELYDIVNSITTDENVYLYCLKDETENLLLKSFTLHFDNNHNRKFSLNFFNVTVAKKLIAFVFDNNLKFQISKKTNIVSDNIIINLKPYIDKPSPPPKYS